MIESKNGSPSGLVTEVLDVVVAFNRELIAMQWPDFFFVKGGGACVLAAAWYSSDLQQLPSIVLDRGLRASIFALLCLGWLEALLFLAFGGAVAHVIWHGTTARLILSLGLYYGTYLLSLCLYYCRRWRVVSLIAAGMMLSITFCLTLAFLVAALGEAESLITGESSSWFPVWMERTWLTLAWSLVLFLIYAAKTPFALSWCVACLGLQQRDPRTSGLVDDDNGRPEDGEEPSSEMPRDTGGIEAAVVTAGQLVLTAWSSWVWLASAATAKGVISRGQGDTPLL